MLASGDEPISGQLSALAAARLALARQCEAQGQNEEALHWLRQAASTGEPDAEALLGRRLLSRPPFDAREGVRLILNATAKGSGAAAHMLALLQASGVALPQNWSLALDHLCRAAAFGYGPAQSEIAFLAGEDSVPPASAHGNTPAMWERLRKAVNVEAWLAKPAIRTVSQSPRIGVVETFLPAAACRWLIEKGRPYLRRAQTDDPQTGQSRYEGARTNRSAELDLDQTDLVVHLVRARISATIGLPADAMEGSVVLHYAVGEQYFPHHDFFDTAAPGYANVVAQHGQRVLTFLIYLNDGFDGGETDFPALRWRFRGRMGDAVFFWNVHPNGEPDQRTLHAGLAPTSGEKWLFSQWVRGRLS